jgi:hypothetical protein
VMIAPISLTDSKASALTAKSPLLAGTSPILFAP